MADSVLDAEVSTTIAKLLAFRIDPPFRVKACLGPRLTIEGGLEGPMEISSHEAASERCKTVAADVLVPSIDIHTENP